MARGPVKRKHTCESLEIAPDHFIIALRQQVVEKGILSRTSQQFPNQPKRRLQEVDGGEASFLRQVQLSNKLRLLQKRSGKMRKHSGGRSKSKGTLEPCEA